jgi:hypothetical protein
MAAAMKPAANARFKVTPEETAMAHINKVVRSINQTGESICVDVFVRPDGSYGFEEYRREPEAGRGLVSRWLLLRAEVPRLRCCVGGRTQRRRVARQQNRLR